MLGRIVGILTKVMKEKELYTMIKRQIRRTAQKGTHRKGGKERRVRGERAPQRGN